MPVAILYPFYRSGTEYMRGNVGAGGVSIFYPIQIGTSRSRVWRGKDCNGQVIYGWPFYRNGQRLARTTYCGAAPDSCSGCGFPISTHTIQMSGFTWDGSAGCEWRSWNGSFSITNSAQAATSWSGAHPIYPLLSVNFYCSGGTSPKWFIQFTHANFGACSFLSGTNVLSSCAGPNGTYRFRGPSNEIVTAVIT